MVCTAVLDGRLGGERGEERGRGGEGRGEGGGKGEGRGEGGNERWKYEIHCSSSSVNQATQSELQCSKFSGCSQNLILTD